MVGKFALGIFGEFAMICGCNLKAASLIDSRYQKIIDKKFSGNLSSVYLAKTEVDCPEARSYAYGEAKSSWDIESMRKAALNGNEIAQYCMFRECVSKSVKLYNGKKYKATTEAAIWLMCAIHRDFHLTSEIQLQWSDMIPSDKENLEQVSDSIKKIAKFLAG